MRQQLRGSRLPNLLIVGVGKCGTTSLFDYLAQHPDICPAKVKETYFFGPLMFEQGPLPPLTLYETFFAQCENQMYRLEATPVYAHGGPRIHAAIHASLPAARFLLCLRDPIERLWSEFRWFKGRNNLIPMVDANPPVRQVWAISRPAIPPKMTFEEYLDICLRLRSTGDDLRRENVWFRGVSNSCFGEYIPAWLDMFGDRTRIVFFESLVRDPCRAVEEICGWLNLDASPVSTIDFSAKNVTTKSRSSALQRGAYLAYGAVKGSLNNHPRLKELLAAAYQKANQVPDRSTLSSEVRRSLEALFKDDKKQLRACLEQHGYRDVPNWLSPDSRDSHRGLPRQIENNSNPADA